MIVLEYKPK